MIPKLRDYEKLVGEKVIEEIERKASVLSGRHITHVNSTSSGGGVAEMLNILVILKNELGIRTGWRLLKGSHTFYTITKKMHNALQGEPTNMTKYRKKIYTEEIERNSVMNHLTEHDMVIVHDPQPLAMINYYDKKHPWIWRCHIDITRPDRSTWRYLSAFIKKYDGMVVSMNRYRKRSLGVPQFVIRPSIDPLSIKNKDIPMGTCRKMLSKWGIELDKPLICQVSRFDKWKDPLGVVKIFEMVKEKLDAQLILVGEMASDDPEGPIIYERLIKRLSKNSNGDDIKIIKDAGDGLVNALQKMSTVVIQNSIKEGFGLVVSEALWKETPVVATRRGGIPLQVIDNKTGFLVNSRKEAAKRCLQLIKDDKLRARLGSNGKEHVRKNFLVTRHLLDYINLLNHYLGEEK